MKAQLNTVKKVLATGLTCLSLGMFSAASQAEYSQMYVFGDSLSDNGNLRAFTQNPAIPERFSNGAVAVELVAAQLGLTLKPSFHLLPPAATGGIYGNNFATASAIAIDADGNPATPDINLPTQVGAFLQLHGGQAPADALYVVMIGGNDIFAARDIMIDGSWNSYKAAYKRVEQASDSVAQQLRTLIASGARNIAVVNAPDVGATPNTDLAAAKVKAEANSLYDYILAYTLESVTRVISSVYNLQLELAVLNVEDETGVDIKEFDLFAFFDDTVKNSIEYGYTNNTDACVYALTGGGFNPECNFDTFVFFDEIHPTAFTHQRAAAGLLPAVKP
jgi:phospholipase/lecithinase/hemolysin